MHLRSFSTNDARMVSSEMRVSFGEVSICNGITGLYHSDKRMDCQPVTCSLCRNSTVIDKDTLQLLRYFTVIVKIFQLLLRCSTV